MLSSPSSPGSSISSTQSTFLPAPISTPKVQAPKPVTEAPRPITSPKVRVVNSFTVSQALKHSKSNQDNHLPAKKHIKKPPTTTPPKEMRKAVLYVAAEKIGTNTRGIEFSFSSPTPVKTPTPFNDSIGSTTPQTPIEITRNPFMSPETPKLTPKKKHAAQATPGLLRILNARHRTPTRVIRSASTDPKTPQLSVSGSKKELTPTSTRLAKTNSKKNLFKLLKDHIKTTYRQRSRSVAPAPSTTPKKSTPVRTSQDRRSPTKPAY
ncbi:hypothetical protein HOH87_06800 [bacterium]|jgi:hypothetical protein|nr:hypothetical protein [bacterium]